LLVQRLADEITRLVTYIHTPTLPQKHVPTIEISLHSYDQYSLRGVAW